MTFSVKSGIATPYNMILLNPVNTDQTRRAMEVEVCNTIVVFGTSWKWRHVVIKKDLYSTILGRLARILLVEKKCFFYDQKTSFSCRANQNNCVKNFNVHITWSLVCVSWEYTISHQQLSANMLYCTIYKFLTQNNF